MCPMISQNGGGKNKVLFGVNGCEEEGKKFRKVFSGRNIG